MKNLSILYLSCNLFSPLWLPFLKIIKKYIAFDIKLYICTDLDIDIGLEKEIKKYTNNILIYGKKSNLNRDGNLYKRFEYYLNNIESDNILYFHDDMFPNKIIDENKILSLLEILRKNNDIKLIKLSHASYNWNHGEKIIYDGMDFKKADNQKDVYIFNIQPMLIKKNFFINFINFCENNYKKYNITHMNGGLEIMGTEYYRKNKNFIALRTWDNIISVYGNDWGVVVAGIIEPKMNQELLKKEGFSIKVYDNNCLFKINQEELDIFGEHNKNRLLNKIK